MKTFSFPYPTPPSGLHTNSPSPYLAFVWCSLLTEKRRSCLEMASLTHQSPFLQRNSFRGGVGQWNFGWRRDCGGPGFSFPIPSQSPKERSSVWHVRSQNLQTGLMGLPFMSPTQGVARSYWLKNIHLPDTHQSLRWAKIRNVGGCDSSIRGPGQQCNTNR